MKRVYTSGNMPKHVALFAKALQGQLSGQKETEFWEASNIKEFEKNAVDIGYEIIPTMDSTTERGFLVGFDVAESKLVGPNGQLYAQLKMYFVECNKSEFDAWVKKIKTHRDMQQDDYFIREAEEQKKKKKKKFKVREI
jgi:hypothetical protein